MSVKKVEQPWMLVKDANIAKYCVEKGHDTSSSTETQIFIICPSILHVTLKLLH